MNDQTNSPRQVWGTGRVAIMGQLPFIRQRIQGGCPMTAIYAEIEDSLAGMSYSLFTYHVRKRLPEFSRPRQSKRSKARSNGIQSAVPPTPERKHPGEASVFQGFNPGPKVPNLDELF